VVSIQDILRAGCIAVKVERALICGPRRWPELVSRRRFIAAKMRAAGYSLPAIGRALGGRHHTTILYLLRTPKAP
jgi:chromosomal replication initiation ATPase DnaA